MTGIEELRRRVAEAEERFGVIQEQRAKYSERMIGLMNAVEERMRDQQGEVEAHRADAARHAMEIDRQAAEIGHLGEENEQLRAMLHSLLKAIETGGRDGLAEIMQELDRKISGIIGTSAAETGAEPEPDAGTADLDPPARAPMAGEESPEAMTRDGAAAAQPSQETTQAEPEPDAADTESAAQAGEPPGSFERPREVEPEPAAHEAACQGAAEVVAEAAAAEASETGIEATLEPQTEEPVARGEDDMPGAAPAAAQSEPVIADPSPEPAPLVIEATIAPGDVLDTAELGAQTHRAVDDGVCAEQPSRAVSAAEQPDAERAQPGSLDEIMERVTKLAQETQAVMAVPEPAAAASPPDPPAEPAAPAQDEAEPARRASATGS